MTSEENTTDIDQELVQRVLSLIDETMPAESVEPKPIIVTELNHRERQAVLNGFDDRGAGKIYDGGYRLMQFYVPPKDKGEASPCVHVCTPTYYLETLDYRTSKIVAKVVSKQLNVLYVIK